jgi:ubiquinone/menaquinone biosynthesis C-methylase UbiE
MLAAFRTSPLGRAARRLRWALAGPPKTADLTGRLSVPACPPVMEVGVPADWVVRVENHTRAVWRRTGPAAVALRHRWVTRTGRDYGEPVVTPLPRALLPGDWADVRLSVRGPAAVGDYSLAYDLTAGGVPTPAVVSDPVPVHVTFPRATDIDYHHVYRSADLGENSWWVVGAYHSREEYVKSAASRREMLISCGMTPDSRVLDIGCGTGQMALALEDYLSDKGAFYGTDIGREGIEFCRRTYRRPNFKFATGDMTRVPFADRDGPFDLAIFFSVFTHTFVDESVLLLAEARRLLGPKGVVVADVITSDLVARGAGHRGQMWVNKEHFVRLADSLGFRAKEIGTVRWAPDAVRVMFRLARAG